MDTTTDNYINKVLYPKIKDIIKNNAEYGIKDKIYDLLDPINLYNGYYDALASQKIERPHYMVISGYSIYPLDDLIKFEKTDYKKSYQLNLYNLIKEFYVDWFKITDITDNDLTEISIAESRKREYSESLLFWENEKGELIAVSNGVTIMMLIRPELFKKYILYDVLDPKLHRDSSILDK